MSKTKAQAAAEERAARKSQEQGPAKDAIHAKVALNQAHAMTDDAKAAFTKQAEEQPKPAPATPAAAATPTQPSKQTQTIEKLKEGWTAKGVSLDKLTVKDDGKFKLVIVAEGWPTVQVGPTGGITVTELKSYAKAFDAAMDGLALYEKQQARDQKKVQATATAPAPPAAKAPATEKQLETASA
jgi:hypothetical protein